MLLRRRSRPVAADAAGVFSPGRPTPRSPRPILRPKSSRWWASTWTSSSSRARRCGAWSLRAPRRARFPAPSPACGSPIRQTGSRPTLGATAIKQVTAADGTRLLVFDETTKCLAPPDAEKLAAIHRAAAAAEAANPPAASPKPARTRPARPAKKSGENRPPRAATRPPAASRTKRNGWSSSRRPAFGCGPT